MSLKIEKCIFSTVGARQDFAVPADESIGVL